MMLQALGAVTGGLSSMFDGGLLGESSDGPDMATSSATTTLNTGPFDRRGLSDYLPIVILGLALLFVLKKG